MVAKAITTIKPRGIVKIDAAELDRMVQEAFKQGRESLECAEHKRKLVCPCCAARERGSKGGKTRAKRASRDPLLAAQGRLGGRHRKSVMPPPSVITPMSDL